MNITVCSICRNEAALLPFWLRHYLAFADRIIVWDDHSDDGSFDLLDKASKRVEARRWPFDTGIDEDLFLQFAYSAIRSLRGKTDWIIWPDMDEFVWAVNVRATCESATADGFDIIRSKGFNMVHDGLPNDNGEQLWKLAPMGVAAPVYDKPIVFSPACGIKWNRGKHAVQWQDMDSRITITPNPCLKLLHYRYLGEEYTRQRNARNYERCGLTNGDKGAAWSCAPDYKGEGSPEWAATLKDKAFNVIEAPL